MPRHTTMKKRRVNKSGTRKHKAGSGAGAGAGTRARTRKRVSGVGKRKRTTVSKRRGGARNSLATSLKSPLTAAGDAAAGRRLAQVIAYRLGFQKDTIRDIMGESRLKGIPNTISKSEDVRNKLKELGQIGATCEYSQKLKKRGKTSSRNRFITALKGPLTAGRDAAASRRLLQAMALRLGFQPETIFNIMGESRLKPVPTTIRKSEDAKKELSLLGQITGKCDKLNDTALDTDGIQFKDFGNTGNIITRMTSREKRVAKLQSDLRDEGGLTNEGKLVD